VIKKTHTSTDELLIKNKDIVGSIIAKIENGMPSIVGIQISLS